MVDGYFGYYMMVESRLMAYERIIGSQLSFGISPLLQQAFSARSERMASIASGDYYREQLYYAKNKADNNGGAIIEISGPLSRDGECNYGYEDIAKMVTMAANDPTVKAIGLKINSGGGAVDGVVEAANAIKEARMKKKVVAWGGFIGSAAYFLASQADEVWIDAQKASEIGSVGVLFVHVDQTEALAKAGVKVSFIRAEGSEDKALINSFEPIPEDAMAKEMQVLKQLRSEFIGFVRRGRGAKLTSSEWQSGAMYNPSDAMRIGLVDRVGSLKEFINYLNK